MRRVLKTDLWDEAVGEGLFPALAARAEHVVGIDVSRSVLEAATSRYTKLDAWHADVRQLPFDDASFDAVLSNSTLDHFHSTEQIGLALRELHRVMAPGATLIVTLDNPANPIIALRGAMPRAAYEAVWRNYGEVAARLAPNPLGATCGIRALQRLARAAGFTVQDRTALVHCPRVLAVFVADHLGRHASRQTHDRFLRVLMRCEAIGKLPSRYITGHFVAIRATR
jgi:SAM-dependent methyltransferase